MSAHTGYFWRVGIVVYGGGMATFIGDGFARRDPVRVARFLALAAPLAAGALAVQVWLVP